MDESRLIAKARQGDRKAFADLFMRHRPALLATAGRILQVEEDAEDAVSESFLRASGALARFQDNGKGAGPWLRTIVRNAALDIARRNRNAGPGKKDVEATARPSEDPKRGGGPTLEERDQAVDRLIAWETVSRRQADAIRVAKLRGTFLGHALGTIASCWPDDEIRRHALRIARHSKAPELLDALTKAGGRIGQGDFEVIVRHCAMSAEPWKEPFTPEDARGAVKVLEHYAQAFAYAPNGSGLEAMPADIETLLRMVRPVAARKGTKTALHKYDLIFRLDAIFRGLLGQKHSWKAFAIAFNVTYGDRRTPKDMKTILRRARSLARL